MRLDPDELRAEGAGSHLARVFESEAVETLALSGGLLSFAATIELAVALGIVTLGARSALEGSLLVLVLLLFGFLGRRYFEERRGWTDRRLEMSHDAVEKMVGAPVELAREDEFCPLFPACEIGAQPPLGDLYGVPMYVDADLLADDDIIFNAGSHTDAIRMKREDFERLAHPAVGRLSRSH